LSTYTIPAGTDIGHVHLKVADLDRAEQFYCGILGFQVMQRWGDEALFVSAGGYHHHIGLNTWAGKGAPSPPPGTTGLYHIAIRYPSRRDLATALLRLAQARYPIEGAADHGVSEAIYLSDPDGNGVEIYCDRDPSAWPRDGAGVQMGTRRLDLDRLLAEATSDGPTPLEPSDVEAALRNLPGWEGDASQLRRSFHFASFPDALAFVGRVGALAEELRHHPDIDIRYRTVRVRLSSHDAGGVTERDLALARRIDGAAL
jgi:catechol 2,3-dioxygenase